MTKRDKGEDDQVAISGAPVAASPSASPASPVPVLGTPNRSLGATIYDDGDSDDLRDRPPGNTAPQSSAPRRKRKPSRKDLSAAEIAVREKRARTARDKRARDNVGNKNFRAKWPYKIIR